MKVKKIKIENFRGILDAELEFDDRLNVFIGENSVGKTTILDAIAKNLYHLLKNSGFFDYKEPKLDLVYNDLNVTSKYISLKTNVEFDFLKESIQSILSWDSMLRHDIKEITRLRETFIPLIAKGKQTVPIFKYYPANRSGDFFYQDLPIITETEAIKIPQQEVYNNIYHKELSYTRFLNWFFDNENKELRLKRDEKNFAVESKELKFVRLAVNRAFKILNGSNLVIKSDQIKITRSNDLVPTLALEDKKRRRTEYLNDKSSGEKAIVTMVADIAYNLSIAKNFSEGDDYLNSSGIVLIDEIEAHLHPVWQRKIIPLLIEIFPNIQFFITTHSPQVISTVESQHIFIGDDFKFSKINIKSKGLDSNQILKYVFNTTERPREYIDLIEKFDQIIENQDSIKALEAIIEQIDALDESDNGRDIDMLIDELNLRMEAYKFDLAHETHS